MWEHCCKSECCGTLAKSDAGCRHVIRPCYMLHIYLSTFHQAVYKSPGVYLKYTTCARYESHSILIAWEGSMVMTPQWGAKFTSIHLWHNSHQASEIHWKRGQSKHFLKDLMCASGASRGYTERAALGAPHEQWTCLTTSDCKHPLHYCQEAVMLHAPAKCTLGAVHVSHCITTQSLRTMPACQLRPFTRCTTTTHTCALSPCQLFVL